MIYRTPGEHANHYTTDAAVQGSVRNENEEEVMLNFLRENQGVIHSFIHSFIQIVKEEYKTLIIYPEMEWAHIK